MVMESKDKITLQCIREVMVDEGSVARGQDKNYQTMEIKY